MDCALWLLVFLLCFVPHPTQDQTIRGPTFETVVPIRVTPEGDYISHLIPHHYRRSYYSSRKVEDPTPDDLVHYKIPIEGQDHHLELMPSHSLLSPGAVTESRGKSLSSRFTGTKMQRAKDVQCHFRGRVRGQRDSGAALSTCDGLMGYIRTKKGHYIVEPVDGHDPLSGVEHPHLVYKVEQSNPKLTRKSSVCRARDNLAQILAKRYIRENRENDKEKCTKPSNNTNGELNVELLIVLDKAFLEYHQKIDVENYALTCVNMAYDLLHDLSFGKPVNLNIVRMIRLEEEERELSLVDNSAPEKVLEYFRTWQKKINPGTDDHPNHHDLAILLTKIDRCPDEIKCGLMGMSKLAGACDPENQAAICVDIGLRLGYVIAHEIGHTLGLLHDTTKESGCKSDLDGGLQTVMSPKISSRTGGWSTCSGKYIKIFLESGFGKCLEDTPKDHNFDFFYILPGVMYEGDYQCKQVVGPNSALCDTGLKCDSLVCAINNVACVETHMAPADGTSCGEKKWCYHGRCLPVGEKPNAVDGDWGPWSPWTECSRTCGSGVATSERHCDNPAPLHGGKSCVGRRTRHKICSTEPCDIDKPSFRDVQCSEFNEWLYPEDKKVHNWKSYQMSDVDKGRVDKEHIVFPENPCVLFCINDEGTVASLRPRVTDGTTCLRGIRDICIAGMCKEIPCDLDLESEAIEDACGMCHGNGTECTLKEGMTFLMGCNSTLNRTCNSKGKQKLVDIPDGTRNIKVEETEPSDAKIQVLSQDGKMAYIMGNKLGMFSVPGSKAWLGMIRPKQEALHIPGPTASGLSIWIVAHENITIKYSFGIKSTKPRMPSFDWDFIDWSRCSAQCGPGTQVSVPRCMEKLSGLVEDKYCSIPKPKERVRPCEIAPCMPRWMIGDWQACEPCPKGRSVRIVKCIRPAGEGEGETDIIPDNKCPGKKPRDEKSCECRSQRDAISIRIQDKDLDEPDSRRWSMMSTHFGNPTRFVRDNKHSVEPIHSNKPSKENAAETQTEIAKGKNVLDFEDPTEIKLTILVDKDSVADLPSDFPKPQGNETTVTLEGKKALDFLQTIQRNTSWS